MCFNLHHNTQVKISETHTVQVEEEELKQNNKS